MKTKYGALRTISTIYKVLAVIVFAIVLAIAVLGALLAIDSPLGVGSLATGVTWLVGGGFLAVSWYATGELFDLLIDMEANSRASRILLTRMAKSMASDPARGAGATRGRRQPAPPALDTDEPLLDLDEF